jgi:hypothetical protein
MLANMGGVYLPGLQVSDWGLGELVWRRSRDDATPGRLFPARIGSSELVCVTNILDPWTPAPGRTWAVGQVESHTFTIAGGEAVDAFVLREAPIPAATDLNPDPVTWADIPAGVAWEDIAPSDKWFEYGYVTN